ncbi:hypothetical protein C8236_00975 [Paracidovorax avenae]|uniref:SEC-C metal-binding domain-containing protein n=1 Tax=Paracidovorax avenae TaxID=80867 RepID=UPI000D22BE66|nr:SEC-C metal-binding domain-containing protein [Paracidovorax avenae]AVS97535.1 hypothetical protein C8236_00975 [Paracidovorax avenae]
MLTPIQKGEGSTPGERELTKLADLAFFGLWSYPSVHRLMVKGGRTIKHEVVDLIVVFGKDVILFSEKDIKFPATGNIKVTWGRWLRQSVFESLGQLRGAERYIKSGRAELFLDPKCTQPFPLSLDDPELRIHLVAICRNSIEPARAYFASLVKKGAPESSGSLAFFASIREEQMLANPFCVGDIDPLKTFVHIFDEGSLDLLLTELDAGPDFIHYLVERERAIRSEHLSVIPGEEDFLAVYFSNPQPSGFGAYRPHRPIPANVDDVLLAIEEGMWSTLRNSGIYALFEDQRKAATVWKRITNELSEAVLNANVGSEVSTESLATHELAVRAMASENRVSRATLGRVLIDKFNVVPSQARSARVVPSLTHPERVYILLLFPWTDSHGTYDGYRAERKACMELYARAAQVKFPGYSQIVLLATDTKGSPGSSETVLVAEGNPNLSEAEKAQTLAMMEELQILTTLGDPVATRYRASMPDARIFESSWAAAVPDKLPGVNDPCYCGSGRKFKKCCRP